MGEIQNRKELGQERARGSLKELAAWAACGQHGYRGKFLRQKQRIRLTVAMCKTNSPSSVSSFRKKGLKTLKAIGKETSCAFFRGH